MRQQSTANHAWRKWIGAAALGAIGMYLSDPERGKRRRALARDKLQKLITKTGNAADVVSHDFNNRMQGLRAQARHILSRRNEIPDDDLLVERVRSKIGHAISYPHAIKVAVQQGRVTLSGPILASERDQLPDAVRKVPGVIEVEDHLEAHEMADIPSLQGGMRRRRLRPALFQENWPPALRAIAALGGGTLGIYGLRRHSPASIVLAALGMGLVARSMTNMPMRRMVRTGTGRPAIELEKSLYIAMPPETVFDLWNNYENFPRFMSHVRNVRDLGHGRSHWVVNGPAGSVVEWDAILSESRRPRVLAWRTEPDSPVQHAGVVRFEATNGGTNVRIHLSYNPPAGITGDAVAFLFNGDPRKQMEEDLLRMKAFIENRMSAREEMQSPSQPGTALH